MSASATATVAGFADSDAWMRLPDGRIVGKARDKSYKEIARHGIPIEVLVDETSTVEVETTVPSSLFSIRAIPARSERVLTHKDCRKPKRKNKKEKIGGRRSHSNKKPMHYRTKSAKLLPNYDEIAFNESEEMKSEETDYIQKARESFGDSDGESDYLGFDDYFDDDHGFMQFVYIMLSGPCRYCGVYHY
jgi:hypothetical protein